MQAYKIVIPARYASTRLAAKLLKNINGKPLLYYTYQSALKANASEVVIATDDQRIFDVAKAFGASVIMTSDQHTSGTDRIAEVSRILNWVGNEIVVNLQGDEPLTPAEILDQVADNLANNNQCSMATLCTPITNDADWQNANVVKVIRDHQNQAIYFSRATIPYCREPQEKPLQLKSSFRHIGIYAYRVQLLQAFTQWKPAPLEQIERLEQLRVLFYGQKIHVDVAKVLPGIGVDTEDDLQNLISKLK